MENKFAVLLLVLLGLISSCSKPDEYGQEYFPVNKEEELSIILDISGQTSQGKLVIIRDEQEVINGKSYTMSKSTIAGLLNPFPAIPPSYSRIAQDGIYEVLGAHKDYPEYLNYPLPLKVGTTWTRETFEGKQNCRVESIEDVNVQGNTYEKCLKVSFQDESGVSSGEEYRAKGVGVVKVQDNFKGGSLTMLLVRYRQ